MNVESNEQVNECTQRERDRGKPCMQRSTQWTKNLLIPKKNAWNELVFINDWLKKNLTVIAPNAILKCFFFFFQMPSACLSWMLILFQTFIYILFSFIGFDCLFTIRHALNYTILMQNLMLNSAFWGKWFSLWFRMFWWLNFWTFYGLNLTVDAFASLGRTQTIWQICIFWPNEIVYTLIFRTQKWIMYCWKTIKLSSQ